MENSLRDLDVDYVDLYQCHRYDEDTPLEETMQALTEGGLLLLEHHHDQSAAVCGLLREAGLTQVQSHPDLETVQRFASARRGGACRHAS